MDTATIIGFCLFGISELLPFLPVNTNGFLQTFILGFKNSFGNITTDISVAHQFLDYNPQLATIINSVHTNPDIQKCMQNITSNPALIPHINTLCTNPELQTLMYSLKSDNILMNNVKNMILQHKNESVVNVDN